MISPKNIFRWIELTLVLFIILIVCQLVFRFFEDFRISSGIHPSRASIVAISDDLDGETFLLPKIGPTSKELLEKKSGSIDFFGFAPPGETVRVTFNDGIFDQKSNNQGTFDIPNIQLRRGLNILHIGLKTGSADDASQRAFLIGSIMAYDPSNTYSQSGLDFTPIRHIKDTPLEIIVSNIKKSSSGQTTIFGAAEPLSEVQIIKKSPPGNRFEYQVLKHDKVGASGIFHLSLPVNTKQTNLLMAYKPSSVSNAKQAPPLKLESDKQGNWSLGSKLKPILRTLTVTLDENNNLLVKANADIPRNYLLAEYVNEGVINGTSFMRLMFGAIFIPKGWPDVKRDLSSYFDLKKVIKEDRMKISIESKVPNAMFYIGSFGSHGFPFFPGEFIELRDFRVENIITHGSKPRYGLDRNVLRWVSDQSRNPDFYYDAPAIIYQPTFPEKAIKKIKTQKQQIQINRDQSALIKLIEFIRKLMPTSVDTFLYGFIRAIPFIGIVAILMWFSKSAPAEEQRASLLKTSQVLLALFCAISLQPTFNQLYHLMASILLWRLPLPIGFRDIESTIYFKSSLSPLVLSDFGVSGFYPPLAIGIVLLLPQLYASLKKEISSPPKRIAWIILRVAFVAILTPLIIVFRHVALLTQEAMKLYHTDLKFELKQFVEESVGVLPDEVYPWLLTALPVCIVIVFALAILWILVYWFLRSLLNRPVKLLPVICASGIMLLLPLAPMMLEIINRGFLLLRATNITFIQLSGIIGTLTKYSWFLVTLFISYKLLRILIVLFEESTPENWHLKGPFKLTVKKTFLLAVIISIPTSFLPTADMKLVSGGIIFIEFFTGILPLLLILLMVGSIAFIKTIDVVQDAIPIEVLLIGMMLFASFLTFQPSNSINMLFMLSSGSLLFWYWIIQLENLKTAEDTKTRQNIIDQLHDYRLHENRKRSLIKKYTAGEIAKTECDLGVKECEQIMAHALGSVDMSTRKAKAIVLGQGPMDSRWKNGKRGAIAGLCIAVISMIPIGSAITSFGKDTQDFFVIILRSLFPGKMVGMDFSTIAGYPFLDFIGFFSTVVLFWGLSGFLFGYFYQVIRGKDGFEKAACFAVGLSIPKLLLILLGGYEQNLTQFVEMLISILFYLNLIAIFVFDYSTVRRLSYDWNALKVIYGFNATLGYTSLLIVSGGFQLGFKYLLDLFFTS